VFQSVRATPAVIQGIVTEERGGPLEGVMVSVLGTAMGFALTDDKGRFQIDALPPGDYILRANLPGFAASSREYVQLGLTGRIVRRIELRRLGAVGTSGSRPVLVAGAAQPGGAPAADENPESETARHPHDEKAWWLRHLRRSILKDSAVTVLADADRSSLPEPPSFFGRAVDSSARLAASFFSAVPLSGELNLLTTGAFDRAADLFSGERLPHGVALVSIGAPIGTHGDWWVGAAVTQGEAASWAIASHYAVRPNRAHAYTVGMTYGRQDYQPGNRLALGAVRDGGRNAGAVYGYDAWTISPGLALDYGGRYEHYDYLEREALFSPRVAVTITTLADTRVTAAVAQQMLAPGAEEFLPPPARGIWLPPQRTFAPATIDGFRVERARSLEVGLEREFADTYVIGVRRFYQSVDDQLVTVFGVRQAGGPGSDLGHYVVGSVGSLEADGWAVRLSSPTEKRVRGAVDYSVTRASWPGSPEGELVSVWAPSVRRLGAEEFHDVTTSFETDIPETATRVFVLYRINTAFARPEPDAVRPGLDARFDLQVNQALPFLPFGSQWEVLVGIRNLFHEPGSGGSAYDELLVVRPPKRIVGGLMVKF
jgi:hypothetical protein